MSDAKISAITEKTTISSADLLPIVDEDVPATTKRITAVNLFSGKGPILSIASSTATAKQQLVADYICDGTADDVQIQAAIDALSSGGQVRLSQGTFNINATLSFINSNVSLIGSGWGTIVKAVANLDNKIISITGTGTVAVGIENLTIDGNKANQASGTGIYISTPYSATDPHHVMRDLDLKSIKGTGIVVENDTRDIFFSHLRVRNADGTGYTIAGSDITMINAIADDCKTGGFNISTGSINLYNCKAFYCGTTSGAGIYVAGDRGNYMGCSAQDNKNEGISVDGADNCNFINCTGDSNGVTTAWSAGIKLNNSNNIIINGGIFLDRQTGVETQAFGIHLTGTSTGCVTTYPVFSGNTSATYLDDSSGVNSHISFGGVVALTDGITAPAATVGYAKIYVDTADGDLKVKFGDGVTKVLAADT